MPDPDRRALTRDEFLRLHRRQRPQRHDLCRLDRQPRQAHLGTQDEGQGGFTKTYGCDQLVWFETFGSRAGAFRRERQIKEWRRSWKLLLIEEENPTWRDLYDGLHGEPDPDGALRSGSRHSPG
jgi:predicted GIY-YIG superfamily endonuclease